MFFQHIIFFSTRPAGQDPGQALDRNEWLGLMLDREVSTRADKRFANRLRNARLRFPDACIEDVNFAASQGRERSEIKAMEKGEGMKAKKAQEGNEGKKSGTRW